MTREEFLDMYEFVRRYSNFGSYTNNSSLPLLLSTQIVNTYISDKTIDTVKEIFNSHKDTKEWSEYAREKIFINKFKDIKYGSVTDKKIFHDKMNEMLSQTISKVDGGQDIFYFLAVIDAFTFSDKVPINIKEEILSFYRELIDTTDMYKKCLEKVLMDKDVSGTFIKEMLCRNPRLVTNIVFPEKVYNFIENKIPKQVINNTELIAHTLIPDKLNEGYLYNAFSWIDETVYRTICDKFTDKEGIISNLMSNENISENTKNLLFDRYCCDPIIAAIGATTPYISEQIAIPAIETVFDFCEKNEVSRRMVNAVSVLSFLITNDSLSESLQIDIANRLIYQKNRSIYDETSKLERTLITETKYSSVLKIMSEVKNSNRAYVFMNRNCPIEMIENEFSQIVKKAEKQIERSAKLTSTKYCDDLYSLASVFCFNEEQYKNIYGIERYSPSPNFWRYPLYCDMDNDTLLTFSKQSIKIQDKEYKIDTDTRVVAKCIYECKKNEDLSHEELKNILNSMRAIRPSINEKNKPNTEDFEFTYYILKYNADNISKYMKILKNAVQTEKQNDMLKNKILSFLYIAKNYSVNDLEVILMLDNKEITFSDNLPNKLNSIHTLYGSSINEILNHKEEIQNKMTLLEMSKEQTPKEKRENLEI